MAVSTRSVRQIGGNVQNKLENPGSDLAGDQLAAVRALSPAGDLAPDHAITAAGIGTAIAGMDGALTLPAGTVVLQAVSLGFGGAAAGLLTTDNLAAIGADTDMGAWSKLQYGLAEIFVEAQLGLSGLSGDAREAALDGFASSNSAAMTGGGYVAIDAIAADGNGAALLAALEALGLERGASFGRLAGGLIPVDALDELAALDLLASARPVYAETHVGLTTSQNVQSMNVDYVQQTYGLTGAGITIGVISDSFATRTGPITTHAQDVTNGDLPAGITILADSAAPATDEGRAMAQLAYDIAPGAQFMFHTALISAADFAQGIVDLATAGCQIIVDDVRYFSEPFFQDGAIAQAVDIATSMGAMYFSSAGNAGLRSYSSTQWRPSGQFVDIGGGVLYELYDFDPGAGTDILQGITKSGTVTYILNWDEPNFSVSGGAGAQSDMALFVHNGASFATLNTNNIGGDAIDFFQTANAYTGIAIGLRVGSDAPGRFQYSTSGGTMTINEFASNSGTSFGHSNASTAISVGAVDWVDSGRFAASYIPGEPMPYLEAFSSRGDIPILFDTAGNRLAAPLNRSTVDFAAGDGGNNSFFGTDIGNSGVYTGFEADTFPNFFGTSAAAPNAAAVAALLMQAFPTATDAQIYTAMRQSAIDIQVDFNGVQIGDGYDNRAGTGMIRADRAYNILAEMVTDALVLGAGEIAIIGYNTDAATAGEPGDLLSFVLLSDLDTGAQIFFTDRAWNGSAFAAASGGEGTYTYTAASNLTAGTVITINAASLSGGGIDLSDAGETIYAYQGAINGPTHFLYAVDIADANTTFNGNLTNTGLTAGLNAVAVSTDSGAYSGPTSHSASFMHNGNATTLLQSISDSANWVGTDTKEAEIQTEPWFTNSNLDFWGTLSGAGGGLSRTSADPTFGSGNDDLNHVRLYDNLLDGGNNVFYSMRDIHFDTVEGKFFIVDSDISGGHNRILQGNISDLLSNPGTLPTLTELYSDTGTTTASRLDNLDIDTTNNIIYFTHGSQLMKINYNTAGQAGTVLFEANVGGGLNPAGSTNNFFNDMVINFTTNEIYLSSTRVLAGASGDVVSKNFIYQLTGLTTGAGANFFTMNGAANSGNARLLPFVENDAVYNPTGATNSPFSAAQDPYAWALERGTIDGLAINPATNTLYFSTGEILFDHDGSSGTSPQYAGGTVVAYALGANTANGQGVVTVLHQQTVQFGGAIPGLMGDLEIDAANGHWYVLDYNGINGVNDDNHIFRGNLDGSGSPIQFSQEIGDSQGVAQVGLYINHAPTAAANNLAAAVTEASSGPGSGITNAPLLWNSVSLSDVDTGNSVDELAGAVVRISGNFQSGATHQDLLRITGNTSGTIGGSGIVYAYNSTTGVMTLTGPGTVAEYQSAIALITFATSGDNVTNYGAATSRTISFAVFDGLSLSDEVSTTVTVTGINDAPVNTVGAGHAATEDQSSVITGLSVFDVDADPATQDITVTLHVDHGTLDIFTNVGGGIEASDVTNDGTATVTITATQNQINATFAAANGVTYTPTADFNGSDTLTVTTNDNGFNGNDPGSSGTGTSEEDEDDKAITIAAVNDAPTVSGDGTEDSVTIFEDQPSAAGQTVSSLFSGQYSDALDEQVPLGGASSADLFFGIAVIDNDATGATGNWEFFNGAMWVVIPTTATLASATLINAATAIRFNPALDYNGPEPLLTVRLIDDSHAGFTSGDTANISGVNGTGGTTPYSATSVTLGGTVNPVNDAPTSTNLSGNTAVWTEGDAHVLLDTGSDATVSDVDSTDFGGGSLRISITANEVASEDSLTFDMGQVSLSNGFNAGSIVTVGILDIGTIRAGGSGQNGEDLIIDFNLAAPTPMFVGQFLHTIAYANTAGDNPTDGDRTITWTLIDGDGNANGGSETMTVTTTVDVDPVNDNPVLTDFGGGSNTYTEEGPAATLDTGAPGSVTDVDHTQFNGGSLNVSITANEVAAEDVLGISTAGTVSLSAGVTVGSVVSVGGSAIGTITSDGTGGADLTIQFDTVNSTPARISTLVQALTYANSNTLNPSTTARTISVTVTDPASGADSQSVTMNVVDVAENATPVVDLDGGSGGVNYSVGFTEGDAAIPIGTSILVSDADVGDMIESARITLTDEIAGDDLFIDGTLPVGFSANITNNAGSIVIDITGPGTAADYQTMLGQIRYVTTSDNPTVGGTDMARTIEVTVNDGTIDSAVATTTVNLTGTDDTPVAQNDAFTITESGTISGGDLFANNGSGADLDPDDPLAISEVNGMGGNVGMQITLASGALLTVNANGTFDYDPNGAFILTPAPGSGASNTPGQDSFTYKLANGNTVTVTITLTGEDTSDTLRGTAGADTLAGGIGDDRYFVENAGDVVTEAVGEGNDRVFASVSYTLGANESVELLSTTNHAGTAPINLAGNNFTNLIYGNEGMNMLTGADAGDTLVGWGGNDVLRGNLGVDTTYGGLGDDWHFVDNVGDVVREVAGEGNDRLFTSISYALVAGLSVEVFSTDNHAGTGAINLTGNELGNVIYGNAGANTLQGLDGADLLVGLGGNDVLRGGTGVDTTYGGLGDDFHYVDDAGDLIRENVGEGTDRVFTSVSYTLTTAQEVEVLTTDNMAGTGALNLTGNSFANTIYGNAGDNVLDGKGGNDLLVGLAGADTFQFTTAFNPNNIDIISGFQHGVDLIALDDAIFTQAGATGALNANAFHTGAGAHDADDRIIYNNVTGALLYDADGLGGNAAVQFATLGTGLTITASDFMVI